jgi:hypothetical protein
VVEGGGLLPRGYGFTLRGADGGGFLVWQTPGCNGSFLTALPEGDYLVSTALPAGYVTALTYGSTNLLRDRLKVSPDDDAELRITFAATSTAGSGVVGGAFFGLSNFSGLENGLPGPLSPPLGARGAAFLGGGGFATDTPTLGCVFIAGGNATEVPDLRLRFSGASSVEIPVMPDGTFRTTLPKGEYRLTLSALPKGYVLRSIKLGTADLRREAFNIDDTQAFILVVLDPIS